MGRHDLSRRLRVYFPIVFCWLLMVVIISSSGGAPGWSRRSWGEAVESSVIIETIWVLLAPAVIAIDRTLPWRDYLLTRFLLHIPLSLVFTAINRLLFYWVMYTFISDAPIRGSLWNLFKGPALLGYWIVLLIYLAYDYQRDLKERELQALKLEREISESRLRTIRSQLHPRFLFDSLNAISGRMEENPRIARRMLEELGEMLRIVLARSEAQEVTGPGVRISGKLSHNSK